MSAATDTSFKAETGSQLEHDHRTDEEIGAEIRKEALNLGTGKDVIPMTVGVARGVHDVFHMLL